MHVPFENQFIFFSRFSLKSFLRYLPRASIESNFLAASVEVSINEESFSFLRTGFYCIAVWFVTNSLLAFILLEGGGKAERKVENRLPKCTLQLPCSGFWGWMGGGARKWAAGGIVEMFQDSSQRKIPRIVTNYQRVVYNLIVIQFVCHLFLQSFDWDGLGKKKEECGRKARGNELGK